MNRKVRERSSEWYIDPVTGYEVHSGEVLQRGMNSGRSGSPEVGKLFQTGQLPRESDTKHFSCLFQAGLPLRVMFWLDPCPHQSICLALL